jgi:hypothetical protein
MLHNRHPADALADVRAEIKQLEIREAELRNELLADSADRRGVEWEAVIKNRSQDRVDAKAAIKHFGEDVLRPFFEEGHHERRVAHTDATGAGARRMIRSWRAGSDATTVTRPAAQPLALQSALLRLAARVSRLSLSVRDPSHFAVERSEIADQLRRLARHTPEGIHR